MGVGSRVLNNPQASIAFDDIGATYGQFTVPSTAWSHPSRMLILKNGTNANIVISIDGGRSDFLTIFTNESVILDLVSNSKPYGDSGLYFVADSTQLQLKYESGAPTSGSVYASSLYEYGE